MKICYINGQLVKAAQYLPCNAKEILQMIGGKQYKFNNTVNDKGTLSIWMDDHDLVVWKGDWLIKSVNEELSTCTDMRLRYEISGVKEDVKWFDFVSEELYSEYKLQRNSYDK